MTIPDQYLAVQKSSLICVLHNNHTTESYALFTNVKLLYAYTSLQQLLPWKTTPTVRKRHLFGTYRLSGVYSLADLLAKFKS